jgi:3-hydroxy-9,10-secoandrosta-1,3,5(10)-triene-9,17-dione monooxygenase reductase component
LPIDRQQFKALLRRWASGVTVVTTRAGDRIAGMTVSSFSAVSLDPPLVLVCADKKALTLPLIAEAGVFAVNVLAHDQFELSAQFALSGNEELRFEGLAWREGPTGSPWLPGVVAVLDCRIVAAHDAGDHVIHVGQVEAAEIDPEREPLLYYDGGYRRLAPQGS